MCNSIQNGEKLTLNRSGGPGNGNNDVSGFYRTAEQDIETRHGNKNVT